MCRAEEEGVTEEWAEDKEEKTILYLVILIKVTQNKSKWKVSEKKMDPRINKIHF